MLVASALFLLGVVTVSPASLPARGEREAFVELDRAAMVRIEARSAAGTACSLVDRRRGPFASAGRAGKESCVLELLLDPGRYKLRLSSPSKGKGEVALSAAEFAEVNGSPLQLANDRTLRASLEPGKQSSFWLHLDKPALRRITVSGRTAGRVELWADGEWLLQHEGSDLSPSPKKGQPLHEWRIQRQLPAGDTRLTVYGVGAARWTNGAEPVELAVAVGAPAAPAEGLADALIPASGFVEWRLGPGLGGAWLATDSGREGELPRLELHALDGDGSIRSMDRGCAIQPKARPAGCGATLGSPTGQVAIVRGEPGTPVRAEFLRGAPSDGLVSSRKGAASPASRPPVDWFLPPGAEPDFWPTVSGPHLVTLRELPPTSDEAPLTCSLFRRPIAGGSFDFQQPIARSLLHLSSAERWERSFNHGNDETIWFELDGGPGGRGAATLETRGELGQHCSIFNESTNTWTQLTEDGKECRLAQPIGAGRYALRLSGGKRGVLTLAIGDLKAGKRSAAVRTSCSFLAPLDTGFVYRVGTSRRFAGAGQVLQARPMPSALALPLRLELGPAEQQTVPMTGGDVEVVGLPQSAFLCGRAAAGTAGLAAAGKGRCSVHLSNGEELLVANQGETAVTISLQRPAQVAAPPAPGAAHPAPVRLAELQEGTPLPVDLDTGEERTLLFTLREGGLVELTTEGLLATSCALRTPVFPELLRDEGSGRGRNCRVAEVLSPGRYAATVKTLNQSRGHGSVVLRRRAVVVAPALAGAGDRFYRVEAGALATGKVRIAKAGSYRLRYAALGARLACRFEDGEGWPLFPTPADCSRELSLAAGDFEVSQLPLTVESQRHASLEPVRARQTLRGRKDHRIALNQRYPVQLAQRGFDRFRFRVPAALTIGIELTGGMQGRLYRKGESTPLEVIAPDAGEGTEGSAGAGNAEAQEGDGENERAAQEPETLDVPIVRDPGDGDEAAAQEPCSDDDTTCQEARAAAEEARAGEQQQAQADAEAQAVAARWAARAEEEERREQARARAVAASRARTTLQLQPGEYVLRTEHSRGDVAIAYEVGLVAAELAPGLSVPVDVPRSGAQRVTVVMPASGLLRLRTSGESDVRCRLWSGDRLVAASDDDGDDWNCAFAEPLAAGRYTLAIESQTFSAGQTRASASVAAERLVSPTSSGALQLGADVALLELPAAGDDTVAEVSVDGGERFSCALEAPDGSIRFRSDDQKRCSFLTRSGGRQRLRLWTRGKAVPVRVATGARPLLAATPGRIEPGTAALLDVPRPGRYRTGEELYCLPDGARGLLRPCGGSASFEAGKWVVATLGLDTKARVELAPEVVEVEAERAEEWTLAPADAAAPNVWRQTSRAAGLQLLEVRVPPGARAQPACELSGDDRSSARLLARDGCFASAGIGREAVVRASASTGVAGPGQAVSRTLALPRSGTAARLLPGRTPLQWSGEVARFPLPAGPGRLDLILSPGAWAVLLDAVGGAVDLCAPQRELARCALSTAGTGGELAIALGDSPQAEATFTALPAAQLPLRLTAATPLVEVRSPEARSLAVELPPVFDDPTLADDSAPASQQALLQVEVEGAERCQLELRGGRRTEGCLQPVPLGEAALLRVLAGPGIWRAALSAAPSSRAALRLGLQLPAAAKAGPAAPEATAALPGLSPGVAAPLATDRPTERQVVLAAETVVHLRSESGSCALRDEAGAVLAQDGLDRGCRIDRVLGPGRYRVSARPAAGLGLPGLLTLSTEPLPEGQEGVGDERSIGPGEVRILRFALASDGELGLGLQVAADRLSCELQDEAQRTLGTGCQQFLRLAKGRYLLRVAAPPDAPPLRFRPVLLGLLGGERGIPDDVLRELVSRLGGEP